MALKRLLLMVLCCGLGALVVAPAAAADGAMPSAGRLPTAEQTQWTFAFYADFDNDLDYTWERFTLPALKQIPANAGVNIVVLLDRSRTKGVQLLQISGGEEHLVTTFPEKDMGSAETLRWFIDLMDYMFPSRHLAVSVVDHGYAWRYFASDSRSHSRIRMPGLSRALRAAARPLDILAFDCCNMASVEVAYQAAATGKVRYLVASEETVDQDGFPYGMMLAPLMADAGRTPQTVVRDMVRGWMAYYRPMRWANWVNLAAIDVQAVRAAKSHLRRWAARMLDLLPSYRAVYRRGLARAYHAWDSDQVDLGDLCRRLLQAGFSDPELRTRTRQVAADVAAATLGLSSGSVARDCSGLTIWWPDGQGYRKEGRLYGRTAFAAATQWKTFLHAYARPGQTAARLIQPQRPLGLTWIGGPTGAPLAAGYDNETARAIALRSTDGGTSWRVTTKGLSAYTLNAAASAGETRWWAVGSDSTGGRAVILHSTDGGRHWAKQKNNVTCTLFGIDMVNARQGWAVGSSGVLLRTQTGGRDPDGSGPRRAWEWMKSGTRAWLYDVQFQGSARGWAVGTLPPHNSGVILHTTNGGADPDDDGPATSWNVIASPAAGGLFDLAVRPSGAAWAVGGNPDGSSAAIVHTANGTDWFAQSTPPSGCLNAVYFHDDRTGWAVGDGGSILHTVNAGATWEQQSSGVSFDLYDVRFTSATHGTAVGDAAVRLITMDGGVTWERRPVIVL